MQHHFKIAKQDALEALGKTAEEFIQVFKHGTLSAEIYKPDQTDEQRPHEKDEIYVVIAGQGKFYYNGEISDFETGDFLFVPAGIEHRFLDFTDDFVVTWVFFYGPPGGEKDTSVTLE